MYVTRPRSLYRKFPGAVSLQPRSNEPYSGNLVVTDKESEAMDSCCCGIWKNHRIKRLPFPSDKILQVVHSSLQEEASVTKIWFIPVIDQPLSSNRYYIIKAKGRHKGQAYTCSREGEVGMCCFKHPRTNPKTRPFDHRDRYQQFEIRPYHSGGFFAKSIEWDGYPPSFLRKGGWEVHTTPWKLHLHESPGFLPYDSTLLNFPQLNLPLYSKRSTPLVIGKWYIPFVFVKEESMSLGHQMRNSLLYELCLKQWWEQIVLVENEEHRNEAVVVDARVKKVRCFVVGMEGEKDERQESDGFVWFKVKEGYNRRGERVGLSSCVFEKMRLMQETRGWFDGERDVRVSGSKEIGIWRKFGCYVLVESIVLRRMDGSLFMNFNFKNTERIECKWE